MDPWQLLVGYIRHHRHQSLKAFLEKEQVDLNRVVDGETLLYIAVAHWDVASARHLIELGADVDLCHPLIFAAMDNCVVLGELLISEGADPDLPNERGETALSLASIFGRVEFVRMLLNNGASLKNIESEKISSYQIKLLLNLT